MKIRVDCVFPPIPIRTHDFCAYDEDRYDGAPDAGPQNVGWGRTKDEALSDLCEQLAEELELDEREGCASLRN
jgi:hypothetical protein